MSEMISSPAETPLTPLAATDFLLPPKAFVKRCVDAFDLRDQVDESDRETLTALLSEGRSKLEIADALRSRKYPLAPSLIAPASKGAGVDLGPLIVVEELERFAPADDAAFLRQLYAQTLGREPTAIEALEGTFDLKSGRSTRRSLIEAVAIRTPGSRLSTISSAAKRSNPPDVAPSLSGFDVVSADGRVEIVFLRMVAGLGLVRAPGTSFQPAGFRDGSLLLEEGWLLAGPKLDAELGDWVLSVDLMQDENAEIALDIVANAGLDTLIKLHIVGPALLQTRFTVRPQDRFLECRLFKTRQIDSLNWLKIRNISMRQK